MSSLPAYTFDELKKLAKGFIDRLPGAASDSIENGWKMFTLAYLNTRMDPRELESEGPALYRVIWLEYSHALETA
jgi:hypothetical protein